MANNITTKEDGGKVNFYWNDKKYLGYAYREVDGLYVFQFDSPDQGVWGDYALREISDKLYEMNEDFRAHLDEYFRKHGSFAYKLASYIHRRPFTFSMIVLISLMAIFWTLLFFKKI